MIGALVAILSLNLTASLVEAGQVARTIQIEGTTVTTPINLVCPAHGIPASRVAHAVVSGVTGTSEANGVWVLNYVDPDTLALTTYTAQGIPVQSVGTNAWTGGGIAEIAFPDLTILLGRRNLNLSTAVATPRIVFIPTDGARWSFEPYGGVGSPLPFTPTARGSAEQQSQALQPQSYTSFPTFEVYVTGAANPPSPDFGDFDATQAIADALMAGAWNAMASRAIILHESWPSQDAESGTMTQRGQLWKGILQLQHPITDAPLSFVPQGVSLVETVMPVGSGSGDWTTITINT